MEVQKRNAQKIYNYISVANQIKNIDSDIYFFLKLYAKNLSMNVNLLPDMNMPMLTAQFTYVGANAKTVEEEVILKIEDALTSVSSVRNITSYSLDNGGAVAIFFDYDVDDLEE